ncbi:MAG TPA: PIG-L family deacetylase [Opitutaceae bacterium]|nr:PIG-L family deacetylase [Opitutaceae bacterium]
MKKSAPSLLPPLLVFGAHPDDIEFGCGGVVAAEVLGGRRVHMVVCSRGEAGSNGTPAIRIAEAERAAKLLGATIEFIELDGDAQLEVKAAHSMKLAGIIRRLRPSTVLAPTLEGNQHPDHWRLAQIVRDASRLARYGGLAPLKARRPHAVGQLFFYAVSPDAEPSTQPVFIDISARRALDRWTKAMLAHASQLKTRAYVDLQLARARVCGLRAGVGHAQPLWPNDALVFSSLAAASRSARQF